MFGRLLMASLLLVAGAMANAAEPRESGYYLGASYGSSTFDDDGAFSGFDFDDQDQAIQAYVGYKFFPYLAMEGRYTNYGTFNVQGLDFDITGFSAHAVGIVPFGSSGWEIFGQLGLGSLTLDVGGTEDSQSTVAAGLGVRYYATENLSFGVQTDVHIWQDDSFVDELTPVVGATQLSVQLAF